MKEYFSLDLALYECAEKIFCLEDMFANPS